MTDDEVERRQEELKESLEDFDFLEIVKGIEMNWQHTEGLMTEVVRLLRCTDTLLQMLPHYAAQTADQDLVDVVKLTRQVITDTAREFKVSRFSHEQNRALFEKMGRGLLASQEMSRLAYYGPHYQD